MDRALAEATDTQRPFLSVVRGPDWRTLLTVRYRYRVLDDRDPRIRAGVEGTKKVLASMGAQCRGQGVRFLVLLLPTKESVFAPRVGERADAALDSLVRTEARLRRELTAALDSAGVPYLDVLEPLQRASRQPYYEDADGHPNAVGHGVIAEAVSAWVRSAALGRGDSVGRSGR